MTAISNYAEQAILNHVFRNSTLTSPTTVYASLHAAGSGNDAPGTEVTGGSYARQAITFGAPSSDGSTDADGYTVSNTGALTWNNLPATTFEDVGIYDASTAGNLLWWGTLTGGSVTTQSGDDFSIPTGQLDVSLK